MRRELVGGREALCQREAGLTPAEERGREDERKGGRLSRSALVRRAALRKFQKFNGPCLRTCSVVSNSLPPHRLCSPEAPLCVGFSQARVWVAVAVVDFFAMSCPTLAPENCSPPGSSVHGILQARTREWIAISSARESSRPSDQTHACIGRWILYH